MTRPIIYAVDFDGTLVKNQFPNIGPLNKNVADFVRDKEKNGAIIILWTTRQNESLKEALDFCEENGIPIDYANCNVPWLRFKTSRKIFADYYIDDRAVNLNGGATGKVKLSTDEEILRSIKEEEKSNE